MKSIVNTPKAPAPVGPYSQAVEVNGFLFCSGQIALTPGSGDLVTSDIKSETTQVMKNIEAVLTAAGLGFSDVVKSTIYLTNMQDFALVNEIYGSYFKIEPPARTTIAVSALPKGVHVEVEVIAARPRT